MADPSTCPKSALYRLYTRVRSRFEIKVLLLNQFFFTWIQVARHCFEFNWNTIRYRLSGIEIWSKKLLLRMLLLRRINLHSMRHDQFRVGFPWKEAYLKLTTLTIFWTNCKKIWMGQTFFVTMYQKFLGRYSKYIQIFSRHHFASSRNIRFIWFLSTKLQNRIDFKMSSIEH